MGGKKTLRFRKTTKRKSAASLKKTFRSKRRGSKRRGSKTFRLKRRGSKRRGGEGGLPPVDGENNNNDATSPQKSTFLNKLNSFGQGARTAFDDGRRQLNDLSGKAQGLRENAQGKFQNMQGKFQNMRGNIQDFAKQKKDKMCMEWFQNEFGNTLERNEYPQ